MLKWINLHTNPIQSSQAFSGECRICGIKGIGEPDGGLSWQTQNTFQILSSQALAVSLLVSNGFRGSRRTLSEKPGRGEVLVEVAARL